MLTTTPSLLSPQARRSEREISDEQWAARVHELSQQTEAAMGEAARHLAALEELKVRQAQPIDCVGLPSDCFWEPSRSSRFVTAGCMPRGSRAFD